jgi:hypothetical protein
MAGLAGMLRRKSRASAPRPAPRAATEAAVSHSSSRRWVTPTRTSVTTMASAICQAWLARNVTWSAARASAVRSSSPMTRRNTTQG